MESLIDLDKIGLSLVPGPSDGPDVFSSVNLGSVEDIQCDAVATALLELPGAQVTTPGVAPTAWAWRAELQSDGAAIEFEMTLFELDDGRATWGGFGMHGLATRAAISRIAKHLASRCGSIWVHSGDCVMWRANVFEAEFAAELL